MKKGEVPPVDTGQENIVLSPVSNGSSVLMSPAGDVRLTVPGSADGAQLSVARRHWLQSACTLYDPVSDSYSLRKIRKTTRQDMGDYGLGVHLYFDFLGLISIVMLIMALICTPLLVLNYYGDFAGVAASIFAKMTIGNIGYCGDYGEYCPEVDSYAYRLLIKATDSASEYTAGLLRDVTPYFGAASSIAIGIFGLFSIYYYYFRMPRIAKEYNDAHITPTDFAVEVGCLPPVLPDAHLEYEALLTRHFERVVGKENCVAEVALCRDYDGAIRTFLHIGELNVDIKEKKARLKVAKSERESNSLRKQVYNLEKVKENFEKKVEECALIPEEKRPVVKAFVIFTEARYQKRVLETYKWSCRGHLLRKLQANSIKFLGQFAIYVRPTCEPANVYQENLDVSSREIFYRKLFTFSASIAILIFTAILLIVTQTATRGSGPVGVGEKPVWIIANSTTTNDQTCLLPCGVSFYSDSECTQSLGANMSGTIGSAGVYTPGLPRISSIDIPQLGSSVCTNEASWFSDRCTAIMGGNEVYNSGKEELTIGSGRRLNVLETPTGTPTTLKLIQSDFVNPINFFSSVGTVVAVADSGLALSWKGGSVASLPVTSDCDDLNQARCSSGSGPELNRCYSTVVDVCNGVWQCPLGDDEINCPSVVCDVSTQFACPVSGLCVDKLFGDCGSECVDHPDAAVCVSLASRVSEQISACDYTQVYPLWTGLDATYCAGFSDTDRTSLTCKAESFLLGGGEVYSASSSMLEYIEDLCVAENRSALTICTTSQIDTLLAISPNCVSAIVHNRFWCECAQDTILLSPSDYSSLETCRVDSIDYLYLGSSTKPGRDTSVLDTIRNSCLNSVWLRGGNMVEGTSPLVVLGFRYSTTESSDAIMASVVAAMPTNTGASIIVVGTQIDGSTGIVRIEISDRSNSTIVAEWINTVANAYSEVSAAIISAFSGTVLRVLSLQEPHCVEDWFQCSVTRECIPTSSVCDGVPDCSIPELNSVLTTDESNCTFANTTTLGCASNEFQCTVSLECIPDLYWCDGYTDCVDETDETDSECLVQQSARNATQSISSITIEYEKPEYLAYTFESPVNVQCITIDQPNSTFANSFIVYACEREVVFREGAGVVLRTPDLSCTKLQTSVLLPEVPLVAGNVSASSDSYTGMPNLDISCTSDVACPILTGKFGSVCDPTRSVCTHPVSGTVGSIAVVQTPVCDYASPISPIVGKTILKSYTSVNGTVDDAILNDVTYTCFCDQQLQYNYASNPLYIFGPYDTSIQQTCDVYYTHLLTEKAWMFFGVMTVAILNFVLRLLMYYLADFERAYSLTDKASSELWKLFLAQFVNTAMLVLVVNAKFYGADSWGIGGIGSGQYQDTNTDWYGSVGAGLCITMMVLVGTIIIPTWLLEVIFRKLKVRWAKKCLTQEAMNRIMEPEIFLLSLRLAQNLNVIICIVMYFSGMPFLLWIAVFYCVSAYWFDKYYLLRCSKIPPQYSEITIKVCLQLLPIAIIANCAFMVWTFGNQVVFPSDPMNQDFYDSFVYMNETDVANYSTGRMGFPNSTVYMDYINQRIVDGLRKASFGGMMILLCALAFVCLVILYIIFSKTVWALIQVCMYPCRKPASFVRDKTRGFYGMQVPTDDPPFKEAKEAMKKSRVISSYKIQENPRYAKAYLAISKLKYRSEKRTLRLQASIVSVPSPQSIKWKESLLEPLPIPSPFRIGEKPGLGELDIPVVSPSVSRVGSPVSVSPPSIRSPKSPRSRIGVMHGTIPHSPTQQTPLPRNDGETSSLND